MINFIKNKYLHLFLVLIFGLILGFYLGYQREKNYLTYGYESVDKFNTFARYEVVRNIASALKNKDYENAKCLADLEASSGYDFVKQCIDNKQCSQYIYNDVKERAPEILRNTHSSFDYLYIKNGIRKCDASCLTPP
jgi:hypothetical protein